MSGQYTLTGSSSMDVETVHTGTLQKSSMTMYPMSLYESGDSNGTISLKELFNNTCHFSICESNLNIDD